MAGQENGPWNLMPSRQGTWQDCAHQEQEKSETDKGRGDEL